MKRRNYDLPLAGKKGFTLIEAVLAITVLSIISAAVLASISSSVQARQASKMTFLAVNEAENVIECFQSEHFQDAVAQGYPSGSYQFDEPNGKLTIWYDASLQPTSAQSAPSYTLTASFTAVKLSSVRITKNAESPEILYSLTAPVYLPGAFAPGGGTP